MRASLGTDRYTTRMPLAGTGSSLEPSDDAVHTVHDAYLVEVIEAFNLCPFARKSRESGRVAREVLRGDDRPWLVQAAAERLHARTSTPHTWEIVLLTFPICDRSEHPLRSAAAFEDFHREFRQRLANEHAIDRVYYSVCFHPELGDACAWERSPSSLVQILRRSPDPVIQCVHVETLERVRKQAQENALTRMKEHLQQAVAQLPPELAHLVDRAVLTDSELSSEIAHQNFTRFSRGAGRDQLEAAFAKLARLREKLYTPVSGVSPPSSDAAST